MSSPAELSPVEVERIIDNALREDLASGDVTTRAVIPPDASAEGVLAAREAIVLSGIDVARAVFQRIDPRVTLLAERADAERVGAGEVLARLRGPAHAVLTGERVALNLLQRMSGVATRTRSFVDAVPVGAGTRIADTRKTTPGLRALERHAVRCGGGHNHRNDLGAGVLIKDNHVVVCGGVRPAIERARAHAPHTLRIEVEVDDLEGLAEALASGADVILLDNFDDAACAAAMLRVAEARPRPLIEVSGGLTLERVAKLAGMGVDVLSIGSLTHGARAVDIGLDLQVSGTWTT